MKFDKRNHQETHLLRSTHPHQANLEEKAMGEKLRVAELFAKAAFLEKKKTAQHQADEYECRKSWLKQRQERK